MLVDRHTMKRTLALSELRDLLSGSGHDVRKATDETAGAANVRSDPDTIVTVGLNLDPTLMPEYRKRYFACLLDSPDNPVPVLQYEEAFSLPEPLRSAATRSPAASWMGRSGGCCTGCCGFARRSFGKSGRHVDEGVQFDD